MTSVPRPEVIYNDEILRKHGLRDPACAYHLESTASDGDGGRVVGDGDGDGGRVVGDGGWVVGWLMLKALQG